LESINHHLQLVGPWIAGGHVVGQVACSEPAHAAVLLSVDGARLLVPAAAAGPHAAPSAPCSFVVPGVSDANQVHLLMPASLRLLSLKRVAGGAQIVLEAGNDGLVVISDDPQAIAGLRAQIARNGPAAVRVERELAGLERDEVAATAQRLAQLGFAAGDAERTAAACEPLLRQSDALIAAGRLDPAHSLVAAARQRLLQSARALRGAVGQPAALGSYPLGLCHGTLAEHASLLRRLETPRGGDNLLYGGDFEDVSQLTQFGWRHTGQPPADIDARAELVSDRPYHGNYCLRLSAAAAGPDALLAADAAPPVEISGPPIHVAAGSLIQITGWARASGAEEGGRLIIGDSLGGDELALSVAATDGWQPFQIVRAMPAGGDFRVSFALVGLGTAEVDAVMVRALVGTPARQSDGGAR
jgi:hypothetical protein